MDFSLYYINFFSIYILAVLSGSFSALEKAFSNVLPSQLHAKVKQGDRPVREGRKPPKKYRARDTTGAQSSYIG